MKIEYSEEVRAYMQRQGKSDVLIALTPAVCSCAIADAQAQLIGQEDAQYYADHGITTYTGELGRVFVTDPLVPESNDGTIAIGLNSHAGVESLTCEGTRPQG